MARKKTSNKNSDLAYLGGNPVIRTQGSHYVWPYINKTVEKAVIRQLYKSISIYDRSGIFEEFENSFAEYHGGKRALLCSSGTAAIHSMYVAAGVGPGDEVICPAYTFFATVTPIFFTGAMPILCDCDKNGNIDPGEIRKKITKRTKAVVVTHMWGVPCRMDEIVKLCRKNNILLFEDCSHAHGARYKGKPVGSFGDMAAWSIQGPKNITGGEGGIFMTNSDDFYYRALLLGHYNKRSRQEIPKEHTLHKYALSGMGLKYRAHPLAIAIAAELFKDLDATRRMRDKFARKFIREFRSIQGLRPPYLQKGVLPSWYALVFQYDRKKFGGLPIERFYEALHAEGMTEVDRPTSTIPLNLIPLFQNPRELFPLYKKYFPKYAPGDFPNAENFYRNAMKFPVWANISDRKMVELYIRGLRKVSQNYQDLLK